MTENVIIEFLNEQCNKRTELEIPVSITPNELMIALNSIYDLKMNTDNLFDYYLASERPFAFLKGNRTLADFGITNGTKIIYKATNTPKT